MAFSRAPPPTRGQQNLLGFMQMSSGQRFSLEQLMVESGRLEPEQTLNHRAWGPLSVLSASRKDVLAAQIGEFEDLTTYEMGMLLNQRLLYEEKFASGITGPACAAGPKREAWHFMPLLSEPCPDTFGIKDVGIHTTYIHDGDSRSARYLKDGALREVSGEWHSDVRQIHRMRTAAPALSPQDS